MFIGRTDVEAETPVLWLPGPVARDSDLTAYKSDSPCGGCPGPVTSDAALVSWLVATYVRILFLCVVWLLYVPIFSLQWGKADRNFAYARHGTSLNIHQQMNGYRRGVYIRNGILLSH